MSTQRNISLNNIFKRIIKGSMYVKSCEYLIGPKEGCTWPGLLIYVCAIFIWMSNKPKGRFDVWPNCTYTCDGEYVTIIWFLTCE